MDLKSQEFISELHVLFDLLHFNETLQNLKTRMNLRVSLLKAGMINDNQISIYVYAHFFLCATVVLNSVLISNQAGVLSFAIGYYFSEDGEITCKMD